MSWAVLCLMILAMIGLGGVTRLTGSGLSIVDWGPLAGIFPPWNEAAWQELFATYRQTPEFRHVNSHFTLSDFQNIFWLEYLHRLLGRLLGLALAAPAWMAFRSSNGYPQMRRRVVLLLVLGGGQGVMGWWMVKSGLHEVPWVSPYRLTAHLLLALAIWTVAFRGWQISRLAAPLTGGVGGSRPSLWGRIHAPEIPIVLALTFVWGGLVAGTKAGWLYPTFPLMAGTWLPEGMGDLHPLWRNCFENPTTVQWIHRVGALSVCLCVLRRMLVDLRWWPLGVMVGLQVTLGALTVVGHVPLGLATLHQVTAFCVWATWLGLEDRLRTVS